MKQKNDQVLLQLLPCWFCFWDVNRILYRRICSIVENQYHFGNVCNLYGKQRRNKTIILANRKCSILLLNKSWFMQFKNKNIHVALWIKWQRISFKNWLMSQLKKKVTNLKLKSIFWSNSWAKIVNIPISACLSILFDQSRLLTHFKGVTCGFRDTKGGRKTKCGQKCIQNTNFPHHSSEIQAKPTLHGLGRFNLFKATICRHSDCAIVDAYISQVFNLRKQG